MNTQSASRIAACVLWVIPAIGAHAQASEKLLIDGSTGMAPLVEALAKAYRDENAQTRIEIGKGLGTKARIAALSEGRIDIAMASHGLDVASVQRQGMAVHEIAKVAVVFGVNADVAVGNLTEAEICDIYSGKATDWKEVGGPSQAIVPLTRPESEVDAEVVRAKIGCLTNLEMVGSVKVAPKAPDMARALAATPGAVGMTTSTVVEQSQGRVKWVSLGGIEPTAGNVQNKMYALTRDSFLVTKAAPSPAVTRFLQFVRSSAGEKVLRANGAVPAKP